jgi:hypothetical protein
MSTVHQTRDTPCAACGRIVHRVMIFDRGPRCAELVALAGWQPAFGLARVSVNDGSAPDGYPCLVRARQATGVERETQGDWAFIDAEDIFVDRSALSRTAIRYLPAVAIAGDDVARIKTSGGSVDRELLATAMARVADGLRGALWTSTRDKADALAIAAAAMRIAAELLPDIYGEA